ncbi:MAG: 4-(cytidine 5'-diphospho)-2-C-methyl-D-erythritol kinase [Candidatus Eremiobacteraeota bacterium]|nr:4-(cytidine 5'-diphospho)-2-C-methyl-D-erythritol kinase [Candidatus Eremiobacteraeota bacterium]
MTAPCLPFSLPAHAKFNLCLDVLGRRPDGLHSISSLIAQLELADAVDFEASRSAFEVSCPGADIAQTDNLVWRAGLALGVPLPRVHLRIHKRIPLQAGLGGGSADAAAALRGLALLLGRQGTPLPQGRIAEASSLIGADVSACLVPGLKVVEGAGETVRGLASCAPPWGVLLLKPRSGVSTAQAYSLLDKTRTIGSASRERPASAVKALCEAYLTADFGTLCRRLSNDFHAVVTSHHTDVARAADALLSVGARRALLCGSGSCVAGMFPSVADARRASARLDLAPGEWSAVTQFVHAQ